MRTRVALCGAILIELTESLGIRVSRGEVQSLGSP